jgi:hypothetical protein
MSTANQQPNINLPENFSLFDRLGVAAKEPEWIFDGLWPAQTIALFTGDGGLGKSHFTLQLGVAIASGGEIPGTPFRCSQPRDFVYITQEDEGDFVAAELKKQCPDLETQPDLAKRIRIISTAIQGPTLLVRDPIIQKYLEANISDSSVFALDAFGTFIQGNEINNTEMQLEMAAIRSVAKAHRASPLLIHHRPKRNQFGQQSSFRGAVAIQQPVRFHIMLENEGMKGTKLSFEKVSRGMPPGNIYFSFDEERGLFVPVDDDPYVKLFNQNEVLTTTEVIKRRGLDPNNDKDRKQVKNALGYRWNKGIVIQQSAGKKGQDATWTVP